MSIQALSLCFNKEYILLFTAHLMNAGICLFFSMVKLNRACSHSGLQPVYCPPPSHVTSHILPATIIVYYNKVAC